MHPHAFGFRTKRGATDAAALISMLIERHSIQHKALDYIKCFDLIPQANVQHITLEQGMDPSTHKALSVMYNTLTRRF